MSGDRKGVLTGGPFRFLAVLAVTLPAILLVSTAARAADAWHPTQGASTLPKGHPAVGFSVGYPYVQLRFDIPVTPFMEVSPYIGFNYGVMGGFGVNVPLPVEGVTLKFTVWKSSQDAVGLSLDTANEWLTGIRILAPWFLYSHRWDNPRIAIFTGVGLPYVWVITYGMEFRILSTLGIEYGINDHFSVHIGVDNGLWLGYDDDEPDLTPIYEFCARFGFSYIF